MCQNIPSKLKDKSLHLDPPITKKDVQYVVGIFGFQGQHTPHLGVLF